MKLFWTMICEMYTALIILGFKLSPSKLFFNNPKTGNNVYRFVEELHVDISFTEPERNCILEAAKDFEYFSNNKIKFEITFDLDPNDLETIDNQSTILRADKDHEIIIAADGYYKTKILGLCQCKENNTASIYLVHDRLHNSIMFRTTTIHELGHMMGLRHTEERGIMYKYITGTILYPTYIDAVEFGITYDCKPDELRYFKL